MKIRTWPLLGLVLVASFLGHDLLMAAAAVIAPLPVMTRRTTDPDHAPGGDARVLEIHGSTAEHPENCRIGQSAVRRNGDTFERADQDLVAPDSVVSAIVALGAHDAAVLWEEPHWPPGTLRALLQVYRV